jgi:asparagine synthase (glutamine-hydrolysing)
LIHTNSVGIYIISKKAKDEGVSVLLSGEGADELFGGYPQYKYFYRRLFLTKTPIFNYLNTKVKNFCYFKDFTSYMMDDANYVLTQYKNLSWNIERNNVNKGFYNALNFLEENIEKEMSSYILKDLKYYLIPLLRRADRMAMGVGLEMRVPYLDNRLVDFAINLPLKFKVSFFKTKYLLKKVAERYLPKDIIYRKKMGFGIPTEKWLGDENLDFKKVMYTDWEKIYFSLNSNYFSFPV